MGVVERVGRRRRARDARQRRDIRALDLRTGGHLRVQHPHEGLGLGQRRPARGAPLRVGERGAAARVGGIERGQPGRLGLDVVARHRFGASG
jgi:hypothetical protein